MDYLTLEEIEANFIENRNRSLWDKLRNKFIIGVNDNYDIYELKYFPGETAAVILTNKVYNSALFTHELMHLDLRHRGLHTLLFYQSLSEHFITTMAVTILNCIEHVLFFDEFVELGYRKEEFVMDYNNSEYELTMLKKLYSQIKSSKNRSLVELCYTYAYWTLKNEEYMGVNRYTDLSWLKKTNPTLFLKCENMFDNIIEFDLDSPTVQDDFITLMSRYLRRNY